MDNRSYYTAPIPYIISQYIREYDIRKANISILLSKGIINKEQYNFLYNADRMTRQVTIGKMIANDASIGEAIKSGIFEYRNKFISDNNIKESEILSVKNDAMFLINKIPSKTSYADGIIQFLPKNEFTTYLCINKNIEIYYGCNQLEGIENIEVKGISDDNLLLHQNYFLGFICEYCYRLEHGITYDTIRWFNDFFKSYLNMELEPSYYRTFDARSVINTVNIGMYYYGLKGYNLDQNTIDISFNLNILRQLYRYLLEIQFSQKV